MKMVMNGEMRALDIHLKQGGMKRKRKKRGERNVRKVSSK